jgi:hypothetical protein
MAVTLTTRMPTARRAKPERLAAATIATMDPER